jgi:hypothetical protein
VCVGVSVCICAYMDVGMYVHYGCVHVYNVYLCMYVRLYVRKYVCERVSVPISE